MEDSLSLLVYLIIPLLGPIISIPVVSVVVLFGLVWAPFGALICRRIARSRGFDPRRYTIAGAVYPVLFFLPWVYLVMRMRGRSVPIVVVRSIYVLLYGTWLVLSIWPLHIWRQVFLSAESLSLALPDRHPLDPSTREALTVVPVMLILSILIFVGSLVMIAVVMGKQKYKTLDRPGEADESIQGDVLPHIAYILPFAFLMFCLVVPPLYLLRENLFGL